MKTSGFCKLFGGGASQVAVLKEFGDEGPELRIYFQPKSSLLGVILTAIQFEDTDAGHRARNTAFEKVSEAQVRAIVAATSAPIEEAFGDDEATDGS